jgi:quercetin dioxygenase-like cupin family protein
MVAFDKARYGIDSYLEWLKKEGLRVVEGLAIDCNNVETAEWPRLGARAAALHLDGRGDFCNMILCELAPGKSTTPQRHLFEEVIYVVAGSGSTQLQLPNGERRSFEWGERSLFAIPLNAEYRHFNGSGSARALFVSTTNLPMMLNLFHSERFVFGNPFDFDDRIGKKEYFEGEGVLTLLRQGNDTWETNFVPDIGTIELPDFSDRGAGGGCLIFLLSDSSMHAHVSEMPAGTYKKAHRHGAGYHVMCVGGSGYSLMWHEGQRDFIRIDWTHGVVFPPADQQFHQHFTTSKVPARYLATGFGSLRYPFTTARRQEILGEKVSFSTSTKEGGDQIEYADQDPRIHPIFLAEMEKHGIKAKMDRFFPAPAEPVR